MAISRAWHVAFSTYKRDGDPVTTPVWLADLGGGNLGFCTSSMSGKAKRLRNSSRVMVQPCSVQGTLKPGSIPINGKATLVTDGEQLEIIRAAIRRKYTVLVPISRFFSVLGGLVKGRKPYADCGVIFHLEP